ncbi:DUF4255 domain-containing protein [Algibacter miyuki]|uniref:DUF4255 domain-containing protein n=1 Tax=Algibacter miyuki TaxID=1306933 RepID=A0ABV5H4E0_9FLAO|nr:DUF4255 domain-containing protein [Algibacter miyuki]MDN3663811.1 DUF4255 domain-containing protein [Algibacter miyuki]
MIHATLNYVKDVLNENFRNEFSISENKVVLSNIINPDGSAVNNTYDKIVFFLINIEEETMLKNNQNRYSQNDSGSFAQTNPTLFLNLHLAFCANFTGSNYSEGLRYLSALIRFFQDRPILNPKLSNSSAKDGRLVFELCKLDYSELSHVWSSVGSKLLPSAIYKVRVLSMEKGAVTKVVPAITNPNKQF